MQMKSWCKCIALTLTASLLLAGCGAKQQERDVIKIGALAESTGNNSSYGTAIINGMRLAVKEVNEKGVLGKKLELVVMDTKSSPAEAAKGMAYLVNDEKVSAVSGIFASASAVSASEVSEAAKIPFLVSGATNPSVTLNKDGSVKPYTFRTCFTDPFQGDVAARFAIDSLQAKRAVVFVDSSSDYSQGLAERFESYFKAKSGAIAGKFSYVQGSNDFQAELTKIKAQQPDVLYIPGYYEEVGRIVKQARSMGITCAILGGDGWDSPKLPEIATVKALNNTYFTNHFSPDADTAEVKDFVVKYMKEYKQKPLACAVLGYDSIKLLAAAMESAGSPDAAKLADVLAKMKNFAAVTGSMSIDKNHDAVRSTVIIEYKDGRQVYKTTIQP